MTSPLLRLASVVCLASALGLAGCGSTGQLSMRSAVGPTIQLTGNFNKAVYGYDDKNTVNVLLVEGPDDKPTQVVHVEMRWAPRAGRTPIDELSTNAVIRYVIFTGESAGVYSGAGFLFPQNNPGGDSFTGSVRNSALRLRDRSENFHDRLGLAEVSGGFTAQRDDAQTQRLLNSVQVHLRQQLGYPAFVQQMQPAVNLAAK